MAYSVVQHQVSASGVASLTGGFSAALTWTSTPVQGRLLLVGIVQRGNWPITGPGGGWVKAVSVTNGTTCQTDIWYKIAGASESTTGPVFGVAFGVGTLYEIAQAEITGFTGTPTLDLTGTVTGTAVATLQVGVGGSTAAATEFFFAVCGDSQGATAGLTWSASTAAGGSTLGADIDTVNPAKNGEGLRDTWATTGNISTAPNITFNISAVTNNILAAVSTSFQDVLASSIRTGPIRTSLQAVNRAGTY